MKSFIRRFLGILICMLFVTTIYPLYAVEDIPWVHPGWIPNAKCKVFIFGDNPVCFISEEVFTIQIIGDQKDTEVLSLSDKEYRIHVKSDQGVQILLESIRPVFFTYENPQNAFMHYAVMYQQLNIPWQRRIYIENYLSPVRGNQIKFPAEDYQVADSVNFGAPFSWGGKQSLEGIAAKLNHNLVVEENFPHDFQEIYRKKQKMFPPNLDEGESKWDPLPGYEVPSYWTGVDCSGLLEKCCEYAGLKWNWTNISYVSEGDYRGTRNFSEISPGDVLILMREGIVVHFGIISKKGFTIPTTYMIHSAWFTNYRYNTNTLQKVTETSLSEFRSVYSWKIGRLKEIPHTLEKK